MSEEMLAQLAQVLGVEANYEAVAAALREMMSKMDEYEDEDEAVDGMMGDMGYEDKDEMGKALKSALALCEAELQSETETRKQRVAAGHALRDALKGIDLDTMPAPNQPPVPKASKHNGKPGQARKSFNVNTGAQASKTPFYDFIRNVKQGATKAQSYQTGPQGGYLLTHEVSDTILPALRSKLPLYEMGVQEINMEGVETLTIIKTETETAAYWVGEGDEITDSESTTSAINLVAKPLAVRIIIPNKMLQNERGNVSVENWLREQAEYRMRRAIMSAAISGSGGGAEPVGLDNITGVTETDISAQPTIDDLVDAIGRIEDADVELGDSAGWLMAPRDKRTFTKMTDAEGLPILRQNWATGERDAILGIPYFASTVVATDEGTGSDSRIYLGEWRHMLLGMSNQLEIVTTDRLAHRLQTELIAYTYVDIAVEYEQAFEILTGVQA